MKYFLLLGVLLFSGIELRAQLEHDDLVFQYLKTGVKSVYHKTWSHECRYVYTYEPGVILETDCHPVSYEGRYFYSQIGRFDSVHFLYGGSDQVKEKVYYKFDPSGRVSTILYVDTIGVNRFLIDTFYYGRDLLLDSIKSCKNVYYPKQGEGIADTICYSKYYVSVDSQTRYYYEDTVLKKILKYDLDGTLIQTTSNHGHFRLGCVYEEEESFEETFHYYNKLGLLKREVSILYSINKDGKVRKRRKLRNKVEYEYYE